MVRPPLGLLPRVVSGSVGFVSMSVETLWIYEVCGARRWGEQTDNNMELTKGQDSTC